MIIYNIEELAGHKMLLNLSGTSIPALSWAIENQADVEAFMQQYGMLLIRGFENIAEEEFGDLLVALFGEELLNYMYRSTPRTEMGKNVYTATEYHAYEMIPQHNENAYAHTWPMRIGFMSIIPADKGGKTPISDSRVAYERIPADIREEFEAKKIMYVRNYSDVDLPWTEVFQTSDKKVVEKFCLANRIELEWTDRGLRTRQVNQASIRHPETKEMLWFNQAHLFHVSNMKDEVREGLIEALGEEYLPRNAYFGDGTPIDTQALQLIRNIYEETKVTFPWEKNDILLLDNMLFTHGREPFEGKRKTIVGMCKEYKPERKKSLSI